MNIRNQGFTLIELSIVLVIIGLIVGGVLVGRDLILSAKIRGAIGEIERINTSVYTFKNKYAALPGDIENTKAQSLGLSAYDTGTGSNRYLGDGNSIIRHTDEGGRCCSGEQALMLLHLSQTGLLNYALKDDQIFLDGSDIGTINELTTKEEISSIFPVSQYLPNAHIIPSLHLLTNNFYLAMAGFTYLGTGNNKTFTTVISPITAQMIDRKVDDGAPESGIVLATNETEALPVSDIIIYSDPLTDCISTVGSETVYNTLSTTSANNLNCNIAFFARY